MPNSIDFTKKAVVLVTGASQGIGRTISIEISRNLSQNSIIILIARSAPGLQETKSAILEIDKTLTVLTHSLDLSKPDGKIYEDYLEQVLASVDTRGVELGMIFHNAGSTGLVKQATDLSDASYWRTYLDLNVTSVAVLNAVFVRVIRPVAPRLIVVNITSLCGRKPFKNLAMYGAGKSARELFFKVLALEEPNLVVLNYSPGPVDTDMFNGIISDAQNVEVREEFRKVKEGGQVLSTQQSVGTLMEVLKNGDFISGDTVDYFDKQ